MLAKVCSTFVLVLGLSLMSATALSPFKFEGIWRVTQYTFAPVSAMDEETAGQWMGKELIIQEQLYFEFHNIEAYKDDFKKYRCDFRAHEMRREVSAVAYLNDYGVEAKDFGITEDKLLIISTGCDESPFQEIIVKSEKQIIIVWDGVFFMLERR